MNLRQSLRNLFSNEAPPNHPQAADLRVDAAGMYLDDDNTRLLLESETRPIALDRPDFYLLALNESADTPLGRSIQRTIPFVGWVEQQLLDDMRRDFWAGWAISTSPWADTI